MVKCVPILHKCFVIYAHLGSVHWMEEDYIS